MGRTDTGTQATLPDEQGVVERDGVRIHWESYGESGPAILLLPTWSILHSRHWKGQIPYLARHFRVVTFDGRGSGFSDRPQDASAYAVREFVDDAIAVLDGAGIQSACVAGMSMGGLRALFLAADHPERIDGAFVIDASIPRFASLSEGGVGVEFDEELDRYEGWAKYNRHYWLRDYPGFLEYFFARVFPEPFSTKQIEDCVAWGLDTTPETLILTVVGGDSGLADNAAFEELCRGIACPVVVVHGTEDEVVPLEWGENVAGLIGCELVRFQGSGHAPQARDPVQINRLMREFFERVAVERVAGTAAPPHPPRSKRGLPSEKRALLVCSPIGLGHAWRDIAIAEELRRRVPGLDIQWLAQEPVTRVLEERGESIHPASAELASEAGHIDGEAGEHELHAFQALRRMDEIFCSNFMVFDDLVREEAFDVWIGDEAWEVDHFLHENPELKTAPFVWLTDFVGYLPMPAGGEHEAFLAADCNAETIEHVECHPDVRDLAIFIGDPQDVVDGTFGPGLPEIREWTERNYDFVGYIPGFDPRTLPDRAALREELGYGEEPTCLVSVGGSGIGAPLLRRLVEALPLARERVPGLRMVAVTGPRIDPAGLPHAEGLEVRGYVHELHRHSAVCDVAVVQGGLATTMELVAAQRPFVALPLQSHFEQRFHVRHRLDRHGAHTWLDYGDTSPEILADAIAGAIDSKPSYREIDPDGAFRAASLIAELLPV